VGAPGQPLSVSLSPDEKQVAITRSDSLSTSAADIWLLDLARNIETRFTTAQTARFAADYGAVWSPDGKQLAYTSGNGVYVKGGATDAKLIRDVGTAVVTDWTSDGRFLILTRIGALGDVIALPMQGGGDATPVVATPANEDNGRISPDGHWIAYSSQQSGRTEVYVRPFAVPGASPAPAGPRIQISRDGGTAPKWRADGKELFFRSPNGVIMSVDIEVSNTTFRPAAPAPTELNVVGNNLWAASKSGQRFLMGTSLDHGVQTPITVVTNWEATLKR
jgi:eukaryotic-like serine/threonine-protein kinase